MLVKTEHAVLRLSFRAMPRSDRSRGGRRAFDHVLMFEALILQARRHRCRPSSRRLLPELIDKDNTAGDVWADTAYRSTANEKYLANYALRSQIHRKKPKGKPMLERTTRANGRKSKVRAAVEHVFAQQKRPMGLFIRTIGLARATTKIGLVNLVYNMKHVVWLTAQTGRRFDHNDRNRG
jgi:hypothetical protein